MYALNTNKDVTAKHAHITRRTPTATVRRKHASTPEDEIPRLAVPRDRKAVVVLEVPTIIHHHDVILLLRMIKKYLCEPRAAKVRVEYVAITDGTVKLLRSNDRLRVASVLHAEERLVRLRLPPKYFVDVHILLELPRHVLAVRAVKVLPCLQEHVFQCSARYLNTVMELYMTQ